MKYRNSFSWMVALFTVGAVAGTAACGGDDNNGGGTKSDAGDGGHPDDGGDGGNQPNTKIGNIGVVNSKTTASASYLASGTFMDAKNSIANPALCTTSIEGSCTIRKCPGPGDATAPAYVSAGDIDITGGKSGITLSAGPDHQYPPKTGATELFEGGEDIVFTVAGGSGIAGFSQSLKAPTFIDMTKPVASGADSDSITIDRSRDLEVDWTYSGAPVGDVYVALQAENTAAAGDRSSFGIRCKASIGDKKTIVPKSVLGHVPTGDVGSFSVGTATVNEETRSGYDVTVSLNSSATRDNGAKSAVLSSATFK